MKAVTIRDNEAIELFADGKSLGHVGLAQGRNGRAKLAIHLPPQIRIKNAHVSVSDLVRGEQLTKTSRPAA